MKTLHIFARASLLCSIFASHSFAQGDGFIVTVQPSAIDSVARQHRLKSATQLRSEGVYLVHAPRGVSQEAFLRELQGSEYWNAAPVLRSQPGAGWILLVTRILLGLLF